MTWATKDYAKAGQTFYQPFVTWLVPDPNGTFMLDDDTYADEYLWGSEYKTYKGAENWIRRQIQGEQGGIERAKWVADSFYDGEEYGTVLDASAEHATVAYAWRRNDESEWLIDKETP